MSNLRNDNDRMNLFSADGEMNLLAVEKFVREVTNTIPKTDAIQEGKPDDRFNPAFSFRPNAISS